MNVETMCVGCMDNDSGEAVCPKCGSPFDLPPKNSLQLKPRSLLREQYVIGRALGHGGFGITYLAWDIGLEARLAVKEYMPNGVAGRASGDTKVAAYSEQTKPEFEWGLDRFLEEARTLKKFSNPAIVSVDTIFRENGTAYLVMEYLDGWTLEEFLKRRDGKITFETALRILLPVLDALTAVHAEGILHRDISPDNIYLTRAGKVKLIDFGAARNALGQKSRNLSIILKEGYAPEEQYRASGIQGPWTDVYALAATFYHAVTGRVPQPSLDRMAEDKVRPPSEEGIEIDRHGEAALMKALSIKAQDRFQSMEDFKSALTGVAATPGKTPPVSQVAALPPPPPPPPAQPRPPASKQPKWIWPAGLGVVAAGAIVFVLMRPPKPPIPGPTGASGPSMNVSGATGSPVAPTGISGATGSPAGPTESPVGPTGDPVGPTGAARGRRSIGDNSVRGWPTGATGSAAGPTGLPPSPMPTGPSGNRPVPTGAPGDSRIPAGSDYDGILDQAKAAWSAKQFPQMQQLLLQAIRTDPNKPRAYTGLGELNLYVYNNPAMAMQNYQAAIQRGGEAVFHVIHDHSAGSFVTHCGGFLRVSAAGVRYEPVGSTVHAFTARRAQVREAKRNRDINLGFGRQGRPSIDLHAFHIRLENGENFNFAPQSKSTEAERDMILNFIGVR